MGASTSSFTQSCADGATRDPRSPAAYRPGRTAPSQGPARAPPSESRAILDSARMVHLVEASATELTYAIELDCTVRALWTFRELDYQNDRAEGSSWTTPLLSAIARHTQPTMTLRTSQGPVVFTAEPLVTGCRPRVIVHGPQGLYIAELLRSKYYSIMSALAESIASEVGFASSPMVSGPAEPAVPLAPELVTPPLGAAPMAIIITPPAEPSDS